MRKAKNTETSVREAPQRPTDGITVEELAPRLDWSQMHEYEHFAQFYETDAYLLSSLSAFVGAGLRMGEAAIVVATKAHRDALDEHLQAAGLDLAAARASGQYVVLDAAETVSTFMVDGSPDPGRFVEILRTIIAQAAAGRHRVRIFGEMVALLWAEGNHAAAIRLEELWNDLQELHPFALFCAYHMDDVGGLELAQPLVDTCAIHTRVIPAESYTALTSADDRLGAIVQLQQKASLLQQTKDELEIQVEDLRRLHELSLRLTSTLDMGSVLHEVLQAALAVQGTGMGLLSLCGTEREELTLEASSGFGEDLLDDGAWTQHVGVSCGACYRQRRRIVIEDVDVDPIFAPYRDAACLAGFRACHSTPLITRQGNLIGVLTCHFGLPHRPSERERRLMDLYARLAADFIENARLHQQVQQELDQREQLLRREHLARAEAESANRMKDEFLATVSHELRTPLTTIIGWSQMLRNGLRKGRLDEARLAHALEIIERHAKSQAQLVEDILDVSRVITGKLRLDIGPVDAAAVINAAIDSVQLAADTKVIELEVTLDPSARHISGDAGRLQQVLWNLLANAIKFTPSGGRVQVRLTRTGSNAHVRVSDTGEGISAEVLPFIFDRFRQADSTSTRQHGGLGLGLAIVRHLVELHGGTVRADSPGEGRGASFTVTLPLAAAHERTMPRSRATASRRADEAEGGEIEALPSIEGVRVLLVDDDRDTLQILTVMLTEYRAHVQVALSAAEALDMLNWYTPDVLVSDVAMPGQDGYSLIESVRSQEAAGDGHIPAVAVTASVGVEDRRRALSAGFSRFVPKPVELDDLLAAIADLAESRNRSAT